MSFGQRIKAAREQAGITQVELGEKVGVSGVAIMRYEKGTRQPRLEQFQRIASVLGVDVNWLMHGQTLEQRDQAWKDRVARRFEEANAWKEGKDRLNIAFDSLNPSGQQEAVKRVEELAEVPRYRRQNPPESPPAPQKGQHHYYRYYYYPSSSQEPTPETVDSTDGKDTHAAQDTPEGAEEGGETG